MANLDVPSVGITVGAAVEPPARPADQASREQVLRLAQEFESMMLLQMIRQMRASMLDESAQDEGLGNSEFTDSVDTELAGMLSRAGGFGLTRYMLDAFERQVGHGVATGQVAPDTARPAVTRVGRWSETPVTESREPAGAVPIEGAVTSGFGWRADPFHGGARFHAGLDIRAAYGQEIPVAAPGRVTFAGERGGYGNLVIVEHPEGYESRYAHLSSVDVVAGQEVRERDILGRAGRTGRATAPHLHFEVWRNGERIDPRSATTELAGLLKSHDEATINVSSGSPQRVVVEGADE